MKHYFLPVLLGALLAAPFAHADFEVKKKKGETSYQVTGKWEPKEYGYTGVVGFFAEAKPGEDIDGVRVVLMKRARPSQDSWPWRRCPDVVLSLDGEDVVLSEYNPPVWEYREGRQAIYFLEASIEQIEQALVAKDVAIKVCDDRIALTPGIRLDLMRLRDAYRKH